MTIGRDSTTSAKRIDAYEERWYILIKGGETPKPVTFCIYNNLVSNRLFYQIQIYNIIGVSKWIFTCRKINVAQSKLEIVKYTKKELQTRIKMQSLKINW